MNTVLMDMPRRCPFSDETGRLRNPQGEQQLGRLGVAEQHRNEAMSLSTRHFGEAGDAESARSRAASLIALARFNEALMALAKARAFYERSGDLVGLVRVTIDMVDIYQWLGDYARAKSELEHALSLFKGKVPTKAPTMTDIIARAVKLATSGNIHKSDVKALTDFAIYGCT
jgi:tetratricopeptide (TPR) repeat protein